MIRRRPGLTGFLFAFVVHSGPTTNLDSSIWVIVPGHSGSVGTCALQAPVYPIFFSASGKSVVACAV